MEKMSKGNISGVMQRAPFPSTRKLLSAVVVAAMATGTVAAEEQVESLDTIRVLGAAEAGFNVALTDDLIEARQAADLEDLLRHDPSITVGGGAPVAQKVYVRGLEDTLLNVTIDGATQAGYLYHHQGRIHVEPELIKNIVIKPGAGNAADGAGALGGAIHFNLKDAQDMLREGETAGAIVKSGISSNNQAWKKHVSAYGMLSEDIGLLVSLSHHKSNDNYEDGNGDEVDQTEQLQKDVRVNLSGYLNDENHFSLSYENYEDEGRRYSRPNMGDLGFHPVYLNVPTDQRTDREAVTLSHEYNPADQRINLSSTLYYTDSAIEKRGDAWRVAPGDPRTTTALFGGAVAFGDVYGGNWHGGGVKSLGLDIRNISLVGEHTFEYGFEYRKDEAYLLNSINPFTDEETKIHALFLQSDLQLSDTVWLSAGARYDSYDYSDNKGVNISDEAISPNATLGFDVTDQLELSVGYAKAFKGVSSPEVFFLENGGLFDFGGTLSSYTGADTIVGGAAAGALKGEEADNIEIGFKYDAGGFAASGEIYRQTIRNTQFIDGGSWSRYSYIDDVEVRGYALRTAYHWDSLSLNAGVAHSKPELGDAPLHSSNMGLGTAYGRTWTLGLEYDLSADILLGWDARYVEKLTFVPAGQDQKEGYSVHDIFAQWQPNDDLKLGMAVNNLFNKFYYDQGSFYTNQPRTANPVGLPEPGRDIKLYFSYQF